MSDNDLIRRGDAIDVCRHAADAERAADHIETIPAVTVGVRPLDTTEWHTIEGHRSVLLYSLKQDGWRKGQPVMVNDITIRIENAPGSEHDLVQIKDAILAALKGN